MLRNLITKNVCRQNRFDFELWLKYFGKLNRLHNWASILQAIPRLVDTPIIEHHPTGSLDTIMSRFWTPFCHKGIPNLNVISNWFSWNLFERLFLIGSLFVAPKKAVDGNNYISNELSVSVAGRQKHKHLRKAINLTKTRPRNYCLSNLEEVTANWYEK